MPNSDRRRLNAPDGSRYNPHTRQWSQERRDSSPRTSNRQTTSHGSENPELEEETEVFESAPDSTGNYTFRDRASSGASGNSITENTQPLVIRQRESSASAHGSLNPPDRGALPDRSAPQGNQARPPNPWQSALTITRHNFPGFAPNQSHNHYVRTPHSYDFQPGNPLCMRCGYIGHPSRHCQQVPLSNAEQKFLGELLNILSTPWRNDVLAAQARAANAAQAAPLTSQTGATSVNRGGQSAVGAYHPAAPIPPNQGGDPRPRAPSVVMSSSAGPPARLHKAIKSTPGECEKLDPRYKNRKNSWFALFRVFKMLWVQPANEAATNVTDQRDVRYGQPIFSKIRWFIVVKPGTDKCLCVPIVTYQGTGVGRKALTKSDHAIVHTTPTAPSPHLSEQPIRGEKGMRKSIRVHADEKGDVLLEMSRIDYSRVYTVEQNVKAMAFGWVHGESRKDFYYSWLNVLLGDEGFSEWREKREAEDDEDDDDDEDNEDQNPDDQRGRGGQSTGDALAGHQGTTAQGPGVESWTGKGKAPAYAASAQSAQLPPAQVPVGGHSATSGYTTAPGYFTTQGQSSAPGYVITPGNSTTQGHSMAPGTSISPGYTINSATGAENQRIQFQEGLHPRYQVDPQAGPASSRAPVEDDEDDEEDDEDDEDDEDELAEDVSEAVPVREIQARPGGTGEPRLERERDRDRDRGHRHGHGNGHERRHRREREPERRPQLGRRRTG